MEYSQQFGVINTDVRIIMARSSVIRHQYLDTFDQEGDLGGGSEVEVGVTFEDLLFNSVLSATRELSCCSWRLLCPRAARMEVTWLEAGVSAAATDLRTASSRCCCSPSPSQSSLSSLPL